MDLKPISENQTKEYNQRVNHVMQSWEWGEFRKSLGTKVLRYGLYDQGKLIKTFQLTLHKIPFTSSFVGYLPKGPFPDQDLAEALIKIGKEQHCAFIKVEPDVERVTSNEQRVTDQRFKKSPKPLFTMHNYVLDLTQSEETILKNMHQKFRYNIKVAEKHGVKTEVSDKDEDFETFLKLYFETCARQNYHGHNQAYHKMVWQKMKESGLAKVLIAYYQPPTINHKLALNAWELFIFKDTLYYPYGGSSTEYKNVMAPNKTCWEAIKFGKKLGLKKFDLWGAGDPNLGPKDPYYGFTRFKSQIGADLITYIGTFDLVLNPVIYYPFTFIDKLMPLKIFLLKLVGKA